MGEDLGKVVVMVLAHVRKTRCVPADGRERATLTLCTAEVRRHAVDRLSDQLRDGEATLPSLITQALHLSIRQLYLRPDHAIMLALLSPCQQKDRTTRPPAPTLEPE